MVAARRVRRVDFQQRVFLRNRPAGRACLQFGSLRRKLAIADLLRLFAVHHRAVIRAVVVFLLRRMAPEHRVVLRNRDLPSLPVLPDQNLRVLPVAVENPLHVQPFRVLLPLNPDASVAGLGAQLRFRSAVNLLSVPLYIGNLMQQIPVVEPQRPRTEHIVRVESADPAHQQEFPAPRFIKGLLCVCDAGGNQHGGIKFSVLENIETLGQFVDDEAHLLVRCNLLQKFCFHPARHQRVPVQDR